MTKTPKPGPEYSREREWGVILEDLHSQFRTFGENLQDVRGRVERIEGKIERIEQKVDGIESFLRPLTAEVSDHSRRLTLLEKNR